MPLVIELQESGCLRLREQLRALIEKAAEHVFQDQFAVDDLDHLVERFQLVGPRRYDRLELAIPALEALHAKTVRQAGQSDDQYDVGDERPPAQPPRRKDGEPIELRQ